MSSTTQRAEEPIEDGYGRPVKNLRISLTQGCNQECFYCHHEGEPGRVKKGEMGTDRVVEIVETAKRYGVQELKLTGGEATLRPDLEEILERTAEDLQDVSITTNGVYLPGRAEDLAEAGLDRVNVSLDSLDPETYRDVTGDDLEEAVAGIEAALDAGLEPLKINTVVMRDVNGDEVGDLIQFARERGVELQLIELIDTGEPWFDRHHYPLEEVVEELKGRAESFERREMHNRPRFTVDGTEVEVVRPEQNANFCGGCTRLRVTSDGKFRPCLRRDDNLVEIGEDVERAFLEAVKRREPYCG